MKSFIPWVGGKSKLLWLIRKLSPSRYSRFIDVFGGSGTVTLSRPIQPGCMEVYNDFNSDLTNLFCCVKNRTMALLLELGFLPLNTRDDFNVLYKFFSKEEFTDDYAMRTEDEESEAVVRYARCHYRLFDEKTLSVAVADLERELEEPMEPLKKPQVWKELLELFQQRLAELRQEDSNGDEKSNG